MNLIEIIMECYNTNDFNCLSSYLIDDCEYSSHWVFDTMVGSEKIVNYLIQKSKAIEKANAKVIAKKGRILSPVNEGECVVLFQKLSTGEEITTVLILKESNNKICSIHLTDPNLFNLEIIN